MYIIKENRNISLQASLLEENIIVIDSPFTPLMASNVIQQLLHLDSTPGKASIQLYINSPGGCVVSGLAIYDTIQTLKKDVVTLGLGMCASMGAFLLACGAKKGKRYITPNCQVMFHEVSSGARGRVSDMEVSFNQTKKLNDKLHGLIAKATGRSLKQIKSDFEKDVWMDGKEVIKFGAADKIR